MGTRGDLTEGSVGKKLIAFAIPLAIASFVQALYNLADMSIVGHFIGSAGMSAVTMGGLIANVVLSVSNGLSNGGTIYMGQLFGAGKKDQIRVALGSMLTGYSILALIITGLVLAFGKMLLQALKTPQEAFSFAVTYLMIYIAGTVFVYAFNVLAAALRAVGKTMPTMIAVVATAVLNIFLDFLFVGPLKMGVAGAAIATIFSQFLSVLILAVYVKKTGLFDFRPESLRINGSMFKTIVKIGFPQALQFGLTTMSFVFISSFVNQYGVYASAVSGATTKLWTFEIIPAQAVQMTMTALTAQNIACGKLDRIRRGLFISMVIAFVFAGIFWLAALLFPQGMLSIFTSDAEVINYGIRYFQIFLISGIAESLMFCFYGVIAGAGYTLFLFLCAIISAIVVRVSLVWAFDSFTNLGFTGIALAYVLAPCASGLAALIFVLSGKWKKSKIKV